MISTIMDFGLQANRTLPTGSDAYGMSINNHVEMFTRSSRDSQFSDVCDSRFNGAHSIVSPYNFDSYSVGVGYSYGSNFVDFSNSGLADPYNPVLDSSHTEPYKCHIASYLSTEEESAIDEVLEEYFSETQSYSPTSPLSTADIDEQFNNMITNNKCHFLSDVYSHSHEPHHQILDSGLSAMQFDLGDFEHMELEGGECNQEMTEYNLSDLKKHLLDIQIPSFDSLDIHTALPSSKENNVMAKQTYRENNQHAMENRRKRSAGKRRKSRLLFDNNNFLKKRSDNVIRKTKAGKKGKVNKHKKIRVQPNKCYHLWDFLQDLLSRSIFPHSSCIVWVDESKQEFRVTNTREMALLWGQRKNSESMTYEKLSRTLRYYCSLNILEKVHGTRLQFRFGKRKMWTKISD